MTVAIYVENSNDARDMIPWAVRFAAANETNALIVNPRRSSKEPAWRDLHPDIGDLNAVHEVIFDVIRTQDCSRVRLQPVEMNGGKEDGAGEDQAEKVRAGSDGAEGEVPFSGVSVLVREISAPDPAQSFVADINSREVTLLLLPSRFSAREGSDDSNWRLELFRQAPCDAAFLHGPCPTEGPLRVLVATDGDAEAEIALQRAVEMARNYDGEVTLLFVQPDADIVSVDLARQQMQRLIQRAGIEEGKLSSRVTLADHLVVGIQQQTLEQYSLILIGTARYRVIKSVFRALEGRGDAESPRAIAAIRRAVPVTWRAWGWLRSQIRQHVPQVNRDQRVELIERLDTSSRFDFDFVALISLSTLIASLGLVQNSTSVVIGAMLVAPLMSPLLGIGFALVQGNIMLIRSALRTLAFGFTVALLISVVVGLLLPHVDVNNDEIAAREHPNTIDMIVALASGIAGAYALGRPNLIGALPGIAIATALVPPIAAAGLTAAKGEFLFSAGALLLFLTNMVAIVLGTAFTFWAVGIDTRLVKRQDGAPIRMWPRYLFAGCVVLSVVLAVLMGALPD